MRVKAPDEVGLRRHAPAQQTREVPDPLVADLHAEGLVDMAEADNVENHHGGGL